MHKGKGPHNECASFRGILLLSTVGKAVRASLRNTINKPYENASDAFQFGGKKGQTVLFGAQAARHFLAWQKSSGNSTAVLFCDVASAFLEVLRELAIGATCSDADLASIVSRLGLEPEVMTELHKALKGDTAYQEMGATRQQQLLLHESLQQTWSTHDGQTCIQTHRGTRPGDSWADIVFNILFAHVLRKVHRRLDEHHMITIVPAADFAQQDAPFWQATWADDLAILLAFHTVEDLVSKFPIAVHALLEVLGEFGTQASMGEAKTAAIIQPRGKGAIALRRKLFATHPATWPIITEHAVVRLPLASQYKHLGGLVAAAGTMVIEIRARVSKARSSFWRIAQKVLRNEHFPIQTRAKIFQSTVLSVLNWGSGAWPLLSIGEYRLWTTGYWDLLRKLMPKKDNFIFPTHTLLPHWGWNAQMIPYEPSEPGISDSC